MAAATLMIELVLTRVFDVILNPNMAYMVIACALFSFGLAGVYVTLQAERFWSASERWLPAIAALFAVSTLALRPALNGLPFDYEAVSDRPVQQLLAFSAMYVALVLPFFLSGLVFTVIFSSEARSIQALAKEVTISYGMNVFSRGFIDTTFVSRRWSRLVDDDVSIANGTTHVVKKGFDVGTFTNIVYRNSDETRNYDAIELQARYQARPSWTMNGSYTLQLRNEGDGLDLGGADDGPGATSVRGNYPEIFGAERNYPGGRLPTFQRHRVRLWSVWDTSVRQFGNLSWSALVRLESGRPYSLTASNQPLTAIQRARLLTAGYPDQPISQTIFFGGRGAQQFNGFGVVDLAAVYQARAWTRFKPWLKVEIYNAFNNRKLIAWDTTIIPDQTGATDALGLPIHYRQSPSFGTADSNIDFPSLPDGSSGGRTVRLSLGIRF